MKTKTIKAILSKKFNDWVNNIEAENVKELVSKNTIITGGAITSLLLGEKPKDYDLYFRNKSTVWAVANYYIDKWNQAHPEGVKNKLGDNKKLYAIDGIDVQAWKRGEKKLTQFAFDYNKDYEYKGAAVNVSHMITNTPEDRIKIIFGSDGVVGDQEIIESLNDADEIPEEIIEKTADGEKYKPVFFTTNSITLSNKIQLVIRFYGEPNKIHETYDFEHCCCYWDSKTEELVTPEKSLLAILNKDLFYRGSMYPICSLFRANKFIRRGWNINAGQFVKMAFQISELNLKDIDILEDQLVGVDTLYFTQVINALRKMKDKDSNFSFDQSYVSTIIDRIF